MPELTLRQERKMRARKKTVDYAAAFITDCIDCKDLDAVSLLMGITIRGSFAEKVCIEKYKVQLHGTMTKTYIKLIKDNKQEKHLIREAWNLAIRTLHEKEKPNA